MKGVPEHLDNYTLVKRISKGGMAEIFEGRRDSIKGVTSKVAIKLITPKQAENETFRKLFVHEAIVSSNLRHKNIVHVQDFNECNGYHYIVMEFVEGLTLFEVIRRSKKKKMVIPSSLVAEIGRQLCEGLHYAHLAKNTDGTEIGLIHRDIKPSNMMLDKSGVLKIVDFGVSLGDQMNGIAPAVRGTMGYMSPEQAKGEKLTSKSDLFSMGLLLFELCTLQRFFTNQETQSKAGLTQSFIDERLQELSAEHFGLREILSQALQINPNERFSSAKEMSEALDTKSYNMVQARQDLVSLHQNLLSDESENPFVAFVSKGIEPAQNKFIGFIFVLLIPLAIIILIYVLSSVFSSPNTEQSPQAIIATHTEKTEIENQGNPVPTVVQKEDVVPQEQSVSKTSVSIVKTESKTKKTNMSTVTKTSSKTNTQTKPQQVDPTIPYALLTISADDSAVVFVDGKKIKAVPLVGHQIGEGTHNIIIAKDELNQAKQTISMEKGYSYIYVWSFFNKEWSRKEKTIISK